MAVKLNRPSAIGALSITPLIDVVFLLLIFLPGCNTFFRGRATTGIGPARSDRSTAGRHSAE